MSTVISRPQFSEPRGIKSAIGPILACQWKYVHIWPVKGCSAALHVYELSGVVRKRWSFSPGGIISRPIHTPQRCGIVCVAKVNAKSQNPQYCGLVRKDGSRFEPGTTEFGVRGIRDPRPHCRTFAIGVGGATDQNLRDPVRANPVNLV